MAVGKAFTGRSEKSEKRFLPAGGRRTVEGTVDDHGFTVDASSLQSIGVVDVLFVPEEAVGSDVSRGSPSGSAPPCSTRRR